MSSVRSNLSMQLMWLVLFAGWWPMQWSIPSETGRNLEQLTDNELQLRIDYLILRLGEPSFHAREAARWELQRIGLAAFDKLMQAKMSLNPEIATAAKYLLNSQQVVWTLYGDSLPVRQLLQDYNQLTDIERESRMEKLAALRSNDGIAALVRLARYEVNERLSKVAAITLMEMLFDDQKVLSAPEVLPSIQSGISGRLRPSTSWLKAFAEVLEDNASDAGQWRQFIDKELQQAEIATDANNAKTVGRLCEWTAQWLTRTNRREDALNIARRRVNLLAGDDASVLRASHWALDAGLPELVEHLAEKYAKKYVQQPQFRYLLAESMLARGAVEQANKLAAEARDCVAESSKNIPFFSKKPDDSLALARTKQFNDLWKRGQFEWAAAELTRGLELDLSPQLEAEIRLDLCDFYWDAGDNQQSAAVLEVAVKKADENPSYAQELAREGRSNELSYLQEINGNWRFYRGLAAIDSRELGQARQELQQAYAQINNNPDILIALYRTGGDAPFQAQLGEQIDLMVSEYRHAVGEGEQNLAKAKPDERRTREAGLAGACNQLAWLFACTNRNLNEAIVLSKRSLTLSPGSSTYLDTLGRCYFQAGLIDKAIEAQSEASRLEPFRRQIQRQLAEFRAAVPSQQQKSAK